MGSGSPGVSQIWETARRRLARVKAPWSVSPSTGPSRRARKDRGREPCSGFSVKRWYQDSPNYHPTLPTAYCRSRQLGALGLYTRSPYTWHMLGHAACVRGVAHSIAYRRESRREGFSEERYAAHRGTKGRSASSEHAFQPSVASVGVVSA